MYGHIVRCQQASTETIGDTDPLLQVLQLVLEQLQEPQAASTGTEVFYKRGGKCVVSTMMGKHGD